MTCVQRAAFLSRQGGGKNKIYFLGAALTAVHGYSILVSMRIVFEKTADLNRKWQFGQLTYTNVSGRTLTITGNFRVERNLNYKFVTTREGEKNKFIVSIDGVNKFFLGENKRNLKPPTEKSEHGSSEYQPRTVECGCHDGCKKRRNPNTIIEHGKHGRARAHGCVCEGCVSKDKTPCNCNPNCKRNLGKQVKHGTMYAYSATKGHGCRCEACIQYILELRTTRYWAKQAELGREVKPEELRGTKACDCHEGCERYRYVSDKKPLKHGTKLYKEHGCRCEVCVNSQVPCACNPNCPVKRLYKTMNHGTRHAYQNHKCRCDECKAANHQHQKDRRKIIEGMRSKGELPKLNHGTQNAYSNWGCRCVKCVAKNTETSRLYLKKRKASNG